MTYKMVSPNRVRVDWIPLAGLTTPSNPKATELNAGTRISPALETGYTLKMTDSKTDSSKTVEDEGNVETPTLKNYEGKLTFFQDEVGNGTQDAPENATAFTAVVALFKVAYVDGWLVKRVGYKSSTAYAGPSAALTAPVLTLGATSTTGGTLSSGAKFWKLTAINAAGETIGSNEVTATLTGATSSQPLTWVAVAGATGYKLYRGTATGAQNVLVTTLGAVTSVTDTGAAGTAATVPVSNTTSSAAQKVSVYKFKNDHYRVMEGEPGDPTRVEVEFLKQGEAYYNVLTQA